MSDISPALEDIDLLINGGIPPNKLHYVAEQAVSANQVLYSLAIRNRLLIRWSRFEDQTNKVDLLNLVIPNAALKINPESERMKERLKWHCWRAQQQQKKLNKKGSKSQRDNFLNNWTTITVLAGDVITAAELENKISDFEERLLDMQRLLDDLNIEVEQWKAKYKDLEEEKEKLFQELQEELSSKEESLGKEIETRKAENEAMKKYIRKLEREHDQPRPVHMKDITELSKKQQKRRLETLNTRAQKALWFINLFGLEFDSLQLRDHKGTKFSVGPSPEQDKQPSAGQPIPPPVTPSTTMPATPPSTPPLTPPSTTPSTPPSTPPSILPIIMPAASSLPEMETQTPSPPSSTTREPLASSPGSHEQGRNKGKQFDSVTEADKSKIETVLFLMDKFAVGDAFIHELSMVIDGMPRSYLIKQCRDKLNSTCSVKPIPGGQAGAQVSFKESLINKLNLMVIKCSLFFQTFTSSTLQNFKLFLKYFYFLGSRWKIVR